jgi:hypothetical protein
MEVILVQPFPKRPFAGAKVADDAKCAPPACFGMTRLFWQKNINS